MKSQEHLLRVDRLQETLPKTNFRTSWLWQKSAFGNTVSSRAAQMVLEEASMNDAVALAAGLRGHVRNAVLSKHANHVVQKITEV